MLPRFRCFSPGTKQEALRLLEDEPNAKVLAGGTDLLVDIRKYACCPETLVDITRIKELQWGYDKASHRLSPIATHAFGARADEIRAGFKALSLACGYVGSPQIRNMSTIGGNIANACPAADTVPPLLIHDAEVRIESLSGERMVPVEKIVQGPYKSGIAHNELMTSIHLKPLDGYRVGLKRLSIRAALAISRLSVAWAVRENNGAFKDVRIAIGSCTPVPFRARAAENLLREKGDNSKRVGEAVDLIVQNIREATGDRPTHAFKLPILQNILFEVLKG